MRAIDGWTIASSLALIALTAGCPSDGEGERSNPVATFRFHVEGAEPQDADFLATATDPALIAMVRAELSLQQADRRLHINGRIAAGNGGNLGWSWHFVPDEWALAEISVEVCDGTPRMVEDDLDRWTQIVGRFCPWASRVAEEIR